MEHDTITYGEVNDAGRRALIAWLQSVLVPGRDPESHACSLIADLDGSFAEQCGLRVEVRKTWTRSGNPETYDLDSGEYDLVTQDKNGNEVSRRTA